jgi:hypothetical protein
LPPTSKASGMEETVTARKTADEKTRKSHMEERCAGARKGDGGGGKEKRHTSDFIFLFLFSSLSSFTCGRAVEGNARVLVLSTEY